MDALTLLTDPLTRGPTIASMFMCFSASLMGVLLFLRRESLLSETLSHAAYPGVTLGVIFASALGGEGSFFLTLAILGGAFFTVLLGLYAIHWLEKSLRVKSDAALTFILASFFGVGVLLASRLQFTHTALYRQVQIYLYGQAATMTDLHIALYGALSLLVVGTIILFYKEFLVVTFDRPFANSIGISVRRIDLLLYILLALAIVIGIRSVGVVLLSGMLLAPAVLARQWSHRLHHILIVAGVTALLSGFFGNYLSLVWGEKIGASLPTGPMIVITASSLTFLSILFAKEQGLFSRLLRARAFRGRSVRENILKTLWREGEGAVIPFSSLVQQERGHPFYLYRMVRRLVRSGWVRSVKGGYSLTAYGWKRAEQIVRLHRLWELYLVSSLGQQVKRVHASAEEMEHILTPELEREIVKELHNPKIDPHGKPIPGGP